MYHILIRSDFLYYNLKLIYNYIWVESVDHKERNRVILILKMMLSINMLLQFKQVIEDIKLENL